MIRSQFLGWLLAASLLLASCSPFTTPAPESDTAVSPATTQTASAPSTSTPTPLSTPTATQLPEPVSFIWIAPYLSQAFVEQLSLPPNLVRTEHLAGADFRIEVGEGKRTSQWVYALVAPFPTIPDGISANALKEFWNGLHPGLFNGAPLLMDERTYQMLTLTWGAPANNVTDIRPAEELRSYAWENQPAWGIVPFDELEPRWKVLSIDGITPFDPAFNPQAYPLTVSIALEAAPNAPMPLEQLQIGMPVSNLDPNLMTQVAITGVTALVRGTAIFMDYKGILYPAEETGALLRAADITHISNEIPFFSECPKPEMRPMEIRFCSDPAYFALLQEVGTDVVELTGDHFGDFGPQAMYETLDIYRTNGIPYYGGGANANEARQALILEHHGNRFAFIGCNAKGVPYYASAAENYPGAIACDLDWMSAEITRLKKEGYLVIATIQHIEYDAYDPDPVLKEDLQRLARAGAVIVSGSQAHQPHGMTFLDNSFIHYGLGNLFFDQYLYYEGGKLDYGFIDWHVFYAGEHISTRLLTISWVDLAKNRLATPAERETFLQTIFDVSQWETK